MYRLSLVLSGGLFCAFAIGACGSTDDKSDAGGGDGDSPAAGAAAISPGTWPGMGFDERNWYFNPNEDTISVDNAATLVEKWRFTVGGNPNGTPVIAEGKVFIMSSGGTYALDLMSGEEIWHVSAVGGTASLYYKDGALYAHAAASTLYKLSAQDGEIIWGPEKSFDMSGCDGTSSPIVIGDKVIVGHSCGLREVNMGGGAAGAMGGVEAHNTSDGSKAWTYITAQGEGEDGVMVWSSVGGDLENGIVYASTGNNYTVLGENSDAIHALDLGTGERLWKTQVNDDDLWSIPAAFGGPDTDFGANPIVTDTMVAAGDKGSSFWALDKSTGSIEWSRENLTPRDQAHGGFLCSSSFDGSAFYGVTNNTGNGSSELHSFDAGSGADNWVNKYPRMSWGGIAIANGVLYAAIGETMYVIDASTGTDLVEFDTGATIAGGSPAVASGIVVVGSGLQYPFGDDAVPGSTVIAYGLP